MAELYQQQGGLPEGTSQYAFKRSTAERCIIEWAIVNFTVINIPEGRTLNSYPVRSSTNAFTSESVWRLKINPRLSIDGIEYVGLYIERCASRSTFCPVVEGDVHFSFLGADGEIYLIHHFIAKFLENDTKGIDEFVKRRDLLYMENLLPDDILTVFCELDVYSVECKQFFREISLTAPPGLKELSDDMKKFVQTMKKTDMELKMAGGVNVQCHKAILGSRSSVFTTLIEDAIRRKQNFITADDEIAPTIVDLLLGYIYTGDLSLLLMEGFHLKDLYKAAETYELEDLESFLEPEIYKTKTVVTANRYEFQWKIAEFSLCRDCSEFEFDGPTSNWFIIDHCEWKVTVTGKNVPDSEERFIDVRLYRISIEDREVTHQVMFEVRVLDVEGQTVIRDYVEHKFLGDGICGVSITTRRIFDNSKRYLLNDTLTLLINVAAGREYPENTVEKKAVRIVFDMDECVPGGEDSDFQNLSVNFKNLFLKQKFHDMKINSEQDEFKVHECIITARASAPIQILKEILVKLPSTTVKSFLMFLYTGDGNYLEGHALQIYSLANDFHLDELKRKYSTRLGWILKNSNVLSIVKEAHRANDRDLKSKAFDVLVEAGEDLLSQEFENENEELTQEIVIYLASKVE